jgi:uncharacterized membrane protein
MAKTLQQARRQQPWLVRFLRGHWRLWSCAAAGLVVYALLPVEGLPVPRFFFAWDAAVILYIGLIYWMIYHTPADRMRQRAAAQDEGQELVLGLAIAAVMVSLSLVVVWLSTTPGRHPDLGLGLVALTIPLSWVFIQTIFALHYCHEYYRPEHRGAEGGLRFPGGGEPNYWDFVYFASGIGMAAQVADVAVTGKRIRRIVTIHAILSFFFNVTTIALTVSIVGDAASNNS